jgi:hypothetical protein
MEDKRYDRLRASFEAKQPQLPADFTERVMERIEARPAKSYWRWVAAVACLLIIIGTGIALWPTGDADEPELLAQPLPSPQVEGKGVGSVTSTPQIDTHKKQTKKILTPPLTPPLQGRGKATGRRPKVGNEAAHAEPQENVSTPVLTAEATHASATENQAPSDAPDIVPPDRQALADIYLAEAALQVAYRRQAQAEALRAYAISFEEEDAAPAQPTIAF